MDEKHVIKCPGRFSELREFLYNEVFPVVLGERTIVQEADIQDVWGLVREDIQLNGYDKKDPYFHSSSDTLRKNPPLDALSLVPLLETNLHLGERVIKNYANRVGTLDKIAEKLERMGEHPGKFLQEVLEREPKSITFPNSKTLVGYRIGANFGIGTISPGGVKGGGIRSDSPFLLEVYKEDSLRDGSGSNLAAVIGFWTQDQDMLISQMQSCKNAKLPEGVPFGVGCLHIAESIGKYMGYQRILAYSARNHPIFKEHPKNWSQLGKDFECIWDSSAKKLDFVGTSSSNYHKLLVGSSNHDPLK